MFEKLVVLFNISFFASFEKKNFEYLQRIRSNGVSCIIQTSKLFKLRHHRRFMLIKQVSYDIYVPVCGNDIARECEFIQKYNGWENYRTWDISRADIWIISRFFFQFFFKNFTNYPRREMDNCASIDHARPFSSVISVPLPQREEQDFRVT